MSNIVYQFSLMEILSLLGLVQSVYILVYVTFRSGQLRNVILPILFFLTFAFIFLLSTAKSRWGESIPYYNDILWMLWVTCFPLSMLLVLKVIRITKNPESKYWALLLLVPVSYISAHLLSSHFSNQESWYHIHAILIGAISMLVIWSKRSWLDGLHKRKNGRERYWLIISYITVNIALLSIDFASLNQAIADNEAALVRILIGLSFLYIATTGLFRIFPQTSGVTISSSSGDTLSNADIEIAQKIENLLYVDKVYQELSYGRSDMAKELSISDSYLSRIIKLYFQKPVPQLLNELRIEEAKVFLKETTEDITKIAFESGFNSIATFNRVFKEIEGVSPSKYRAKN